MKKYIINWLAKKVRFTVNVTFADKPVTFYDMRVGDDFSANRVIELCHTDGPITYKKTGLCKVSISVKL